MSKVFSIRLTQGVEEKLDALAAFHGLSSGQYARTLLVTALVKTTDCPETTLPPLTNAIADLGRLVRDIVDELRQAIENQHQELQAVNAEIQKVYQAVALADRRVASVLARIRT